MKRWHFYIIATLAVTVFGSVPFRGADISKLVPVEAVWISRSGGQVAIVTDTGDMGQGATLQLALENLKSATPGMVFLETADYLIVEQGEEDLLEQAYALFRPSCMVCTMKRMPIMSAIVSYLLAHEPVVTLRQYRAAKGEIPLLTEQDGRFAWNGR